MSRPVNVVKMVTSYLLANGYDGLVSPNSDCACLVSDLVPCGGECSDCCAGHRVAIQPGTCEEHGDQCMWHIIAGKRPSSRPTPTQEAGS